MPYGSSGIGLPKLQPEDAAMRNMVGNEGTHQGSNLKRGQKYACAPPGAQYCLPAQPASARLSASLAVKATNGGGVVICWCCLHAWASLAALGYSPEENPTQGAASLPWRRYQCRVTVLPLPEVWTLAVGESEMEEGRVRVAV